jgi:hypothetical protein
MRRQTDLLADRAVAGRCFHRYLGHGTGPSFSPPLAGFAIQIACASSFLDSIGHFFTTFMRQSTERPPTTGQC